MAKDKQRTQGVSALFVELPTELRERLDAFVERTRRKLKGEICNALEQYLDREEGKAPKVTGKAKPKQ